MHGVGLRTVSRTAHVLSPRICSPTSVRAGLRQDHAQPRGTGERPETDALNPDSSVASQVTDKDVCFAIGVTAHQVRCGGKEGDVPAIGGDVGATE